MAGEDLYSALSGLGYSPLENPWGQSAAVISSTAPNLINPYGSTGQALGIALGSTLISSLLGYQARQQAREQNLALLPALRGAFTATTPEQLESVLQKPEAEKLVPYAPQLYGQMLKQKAAQQGAAADLQKSLLLEGLKQGYKPSDPTLAGLFADTGEGELTPKEQRELKLFGEKEKLKKPITLPQKQKDWWENVPAAQKSAFTGTAGQVTQLRELANQFKDLNLNAAGFNIQSQIPGSKADLANSAMKTLVPSTVKMLGDTGALSAFDQEQVLKATMGGVLSGSQSIASRLNQLADMAETKTATALEQYKTAAEGGGDALLKALQQQSTGAGKQPLSDIQGQIAQLSTIVNDETAPSELIAEALAKIDELEAALK
jgi:hypothetical protein